MNLYLTPQRFRTMALGLDLSEISDDALRAALYRASAQVDSYCNVPLLPSPHDFRGGTATDEEHIWHVDGYDRYRPFRFFPMHRPIQTVDSFKVFSTPTVFLEIDPSEVYVHNTGGMLEVSTIHLTQYSAYGAGVLTTLVGLYEPIVRVTYTYGRAFPTLEPLSTTDEVVYQAPHQWWTDAAVEVKKNGVVVVSGITIDRDEGTVTFDTPNDTDDLVTASYTYSMPLAIAEATALIVADDFGESQMRSRGMSGVDFLQVGEISIRRAGAGVTKGSSSAVASINERAAALLDGFRFWTVR